MTDKHPKRPRDPNQLVAGAVTLRLRNQDTALELFPRARLVFTRTGLFQC